MDFVFKFNVVIFIWVTLASRISGQNAIRNSINPTGPCPNRPPACNLNCPHGFAWGLGNSCLCVCQIDPCLVCFNSFKSTLSGFFRVGYVVYGKYACRLKELLGVFPNWVSLEFILGFL